MYEEKLLMKSQSFQVFCIIRTLTEYPLIWVHYFKYTTTLEHGKGDMSCVWGMRFNPQLCATPNIESFISHFVEEKISWCRSPNVFRGIAGNRGLKKSCTLSSMQVCERGLGKLR